MKRSQFEPQLNEIEKLLRRLGLLKEREHYPRFPEHIASVFRSMDYLSMWEKCYKDRIYHFLLLDYSMLTFRLTEGENSSLSYSFLDCPTQIIPYEDFIASLELSIDEVGDALREEYEFELSSARPKGSFVPVRYDYDTVAYRSGIHPASHVHFGHEGNIRIGTDRVLQPISFVLFVLRQHYPSTWVEFIATTEAPLICTRIRDNLQQVDSSYFQERDNWEMILRFV